MDVLAVFHLSFNLQPIPRQYPPMASASGYNHHRFARAVLKKSRKWEPSLTIQLYASHWRFENSVGTPCLYPY